MKLILALLTITYFVAANASIHFDKLQEIFETAQKPTASQLIGNWKLSVRSNFFENDGTFIERFYSDSKDTNTPHLTFKPSGVLDFFANEEGIVVTAVGVYHYDKNERLSVTFLGKDALMKFRNSGYDITTLCRVLDDSRLICQSAGKSSYLSDVFGYAAFVRN